MPTAKSKRSPPTAPVAGTFAERVAALARRPGLDRKLAEWLGKLARGDSAGGSAKTAAK